MDRDAVLETSVSGALETTYMRSWSWSCLGLERQGLGLGLGLESYGLGLALVLRDKVLVLVSVLRAMVLVLPLLVLTTSLPLE